MHVQMSVDINAPPAKVWPYLVEPDKTMQWYTMNLISRDLCFRQTFEILKNLLA